MRVQRRKSEAGVKGSGKVKGSGRERPLHTKQLRCKRVCGKKVSVEIEILIDHAVSGEAFAGPGEGTIGIGLAQGMVGVELAKDGCETVRVVGTEVEGGITPKLAEAGDIVGDDGAARKGGVERRHAERLVARSCGVDCGAAVECAKLRVGLRTTDRDSGVGCGDFYVGADRNAGGGNGLIGADDADRKRVRVLGEKKNLFACIDKAADGEHGVVLAHVGIEEDRVASGIDDGVGARARVSGADGIEQPRRGCDDGIGSRDAGDHGVPIPFEPARRARSAALHGL